MLPIEPLLFVALVTLFGGLILTLWRELDWSLTLPNSSSPKIQPKPSNTNDVYQPIARLRYTIDDPLAADQFNAFLDEPVLTLHGPAFRRDEPPARTLEQAVRALLANIDEEHAGQLSVRIDVQRGSLTLGLTVLAAYEFVAQYQEFLQSVHLLRDQIESLFHTTASQYHARTGRRARVDSDVSVEPPAAHVRKMRHAAAANPNGKFTPHPSSYADADVRITLQTGPPLAGALTCALVLLIAALAALLLGAVGCAWLDVDCTETLRPLWRALQMPQQN